SNQKASLKDIILQSNLNLNRASIVGFFIALLEIARKGVVTIVLNKTPLKEQYLLDEIKIELVMHKEIGADSLLFSNVEEYKKAAN
ncbi:MAG: hypothetical protein D6780_06510, partial [Candidatus Dadabacteria bacterium]